MENLHRLFPVKGGEKRKILKEITWILQIHPNFLPLETEESQISTTGENIPKI